ncbi:MAG: murein hydrolase activator EnvC [Undibacterium sp.]
MVQKEKKGISERNRLFVVNAILLPLTFAGIFYTTYTALAEDPSIEELNQEAIDKLKDQKDALKAKEKAYKGIIDLKQRQGAALSDQIISLDAQIKNLEEQITENERLLEQLDSDIRILTERIKQKESLIISQKTILAEIMRGYYDDRSALLPSEFIINASNLANPLQNSEWTAETGSRVSDLLSSVKSIRESLVTEHATILSKQKEADTLRIQLEERNTYLDSTKESKARLLTQTQSEVKKYDALVDSLQAERESLESEIEDLEAGKINDIGGIPGYSNGLLAYPVTSVRITQGYGKTSYSNHYVSGRHNGLDFGARSKGVSGDMVMAAASGKVVGTGDMGRVAYGKWVAIDHSNGLITLYGHLSKVSVSKGQKLNKGQKIGEMGSTGDSTSAHLHFTVYAADSYEVVDSKSAPGKKIPIGAAVNPKLYLP